MKSMVVLAFGVVIAGADPADAFSDLSKFAESAGTGGGGGRYFTGSPADGYTCSVCHAGGTIPSLTIDGIPDRLVPGTRHEVTIRWTEPEFSHAMQLELVDATGAHPTLELDPEMVAAASRCESRPDAPSAVHVVDAGARRIVGVEDCGASEVSFAFTVPDTARLVLAIGAVRTDSSGTADGDGTRHLVQCADADLRLLGLDAQPGALRGR